MPKQTFTTRILLFLSLIIPIPLIFNLGLLTYFSFFESLSFLKQCLQTHATNTCLEIKKTLSFQQLFLERLANTITLKELTSNLSESEIFSTISEELGEISNQFSLCFLESRQDQIWTKTPSDPFILHLKSQNTLRRKLFDFSDSAFITFIPTEQTVIPYLVIVEDIDFLPEFSNSFSPSGFLISFCPLESLKKEIFQNISLSHGNIFFLDHKGRILLSSLDPESPMAKSIQNTTISCNLPGLPTISPVSPNSLHTSLFFPSWLNNQGVLSVTINNTQYLGIMMNKVPIDHVYTLSLVPVSQFLWSAFKIPLLVLVFYIISFSLMGIVLTRINRKVSQPLQELVTCMEAAWKGNYHVRFEPHKYGYEINELGNIFNCTLLQLLNSMEQAGKEWKAKQALLQELSLLQEIQSNLLLPPFPQNPYFQAIQSKESLMGKKGTFQGWLIPQNNPNTLLGTIGSISTEGLSSYLYAVTARSLFLANATETSSSEEAGQQTFNTLKNLLNKIPFGFSCLQLHSASNEVLVHHFGDTCPLIFIKKPKHFFRLAENNPVVIEDTDLIVCINANLNPHDPRILTKLTPMLTDSLLSINNHNLISLIKEIFDDITFSEGSITIIQKSFS